MNIKVMRSVHLYLGVFFAPLLFFFLISGSWQIFGLNHASKDGSYEPPAIIKTLSQVHKNQRWVDNKKVPPPSMSFRFLIILMSVGLLATTILGIIMSFKYARAGIVWSCLALGFIIPALLLWIGRR